MRRWIADRALLHSEMCWAPLQTHGTLHPHSLLPFTGLVYTISLSSLVHHTRRRLERAITMVRNAYAPDIPMVADAVHTPLPRRVDARGSMAAHIHSGSPPSVVRRGGHRLRPVCRACCGTHDMPSALDCGVELVAFSLVGRALIPSGASLSAASGYVSA